MNDIVLAGILGVVEGITEFLPISSTAHLRIAQAMMGISLEDPFWKLFAIFIQLGAVLSIVVLYRARIVAFLKDWRSTSISHPIGLIGIAFVVTCALAFVGKKIAGHNLEQLGVIFLSIVVGGVVMIAVDLLFSKRGHVGRLEDMKPWQAFWIGLVQTLAAIFPGTSRSMSTIAAGQVAGLSRATALDFSFLVSLPVMAVATVYDLLKFRHESAVAVTSHQYAVLAVGFVVSFVVALGVVAWFLGYVKKHGFIPFGVYRLALGVFMFWYFGIK